MLKYNYNLSKIPIDTFPCSQSNAITKEYYNHLVGEINRGTVFKSVCQVENIVFGVISYYLISEH